MNCPACGSPLVDCEQEGIRIHLCRKCGGHLCTRKAFRAFALAMKDSSSECLSTTELLEREAIAACKIPREERVCPWCSGRMKPFNYGYDSNILLDRCPECDLLWADRQEILDVGKYLRGNPTVERFGTALAGFEKERAEFREDADRLPEIMVWGLRFGLLPLGDNVKARRFPLVTVSLIAANAIILFALQNWGTPYEFGFVPSLFFQGRELYRLVTSQFLHAGFLHLAGNMLFLWIFGDNVEDHLGRVRYLVAYLCFGSFAAIAHGLLTSHSDIPCIGASGAVAGVMGCYMILMPQARIRTFVWHRVIEIHAWFYLGGWFFMQLLFSMSESCVAYFAHIGGFLLGCLCGVAHRMLTEGKKPQPTAEVRGEE